MLSDRKIKTALITLLLCGIWVFFLLQNNRQRTRQIENINEATHRRTLEEAMKTWKDYRAEQEQQSRAIRILTAKVERLERRATTRP